MFVDVSLRDVRVSTVGTQRPQVRSLHIKSLAATTAAAAAVGLKRKRKPRQLSRPTAAGHHGQLLQVVEHDSLLLGQRQRCRRERVDPEPVVLSDVQPGRKLNFSVAEKVKISAKKHAVFLSMSKACYVSQATKVMPTKL